MANLCSCRAKKIIQSSLCPFHTKTEAEVLVEEERFAEEADIIGLAAVKAGN